MEKLIVTGGKKLNGKIEISTSKNATLPILAGAVLNEDSVIIKKIPKYTDVMYMCKILEKLGAKYFFKEDNLHIDTKNITQYIIPNEYAKEIRSSIFMLGPILSRLKKAKVAYPGGCNIGARPIDLHLNGLRKLNIKVVEKHGYIECDATNAKSSTILLDFPSVGATENIIMASVYLKGITKIINPAKEPEIVDLQNFLNCMGAKISGAGSDIIEIEGVTKLHKVEYQPIPDRIVAGTYMLATAITGGDVEICRVIPEHLHFLSYKLKSIGCKINIKNDKIRISAKNKLKSLGEIVTQPYPGFATDLQPQTLALSTVLKGTSIIQENLFETRFKHVSELIKMGADIILKDRCAIINGVNSLYGAEVYSSDLRAGAGLVLAGLTANGYTTINNVKYIDRGYVKIEEELKSLGAEIERIDK